MFAPLNETVVAVLVSVWAAPVQEVDGAGVGASVSPEGRVSSRLDWVRAKPLALARVTVSVDTVFSATVAGEKLSVTVGGSGDIASAVGQAFFALPEVDGAAVVAVLAVRVTVSVSMLPALSVTVSVRVPGDGSMVTLEAVAPLTMMLEGTADQAKEAMASGAGVGPLVLHPATLAPASMTLPAPMVVGKRDDRDGLLRGLDRRSAHRPCPRRIELPPFGQTHSPPEPVAGQVGTPAAPAGNGVAAACMRTMICAGVRLLFTDFMSAAMPDTIGAEKLVPRLGLISFV